MSDPLDYMNRVTKWDAPPPPNEQWEKALARACEIIAERDEQIKQLRKETNRLREWVDDCQSGMYINCVYCGHRYGPKDEVPATMQETLYEHIAKCPKHPLSHARQENDRLREHVKAADDGREEWETSCKAAEAENERLRTEIEQLK